MLELGLLMVMHVISGVNLEKHFDGFCSLVRNNIEAVIFEAVIFEAVIFEAVIFEAETPPLSATLC